MSEHHDTGPTAAGPSQPPSFPSPQTPPAQPPVPVGGQAASGLDPHVGGLLAYLVFLWVGGLIMYFTQSDREVRFHAAQSVMLALALIPLWVVVFIISFVPILGWLIGLAAGLALFGLWVYLCIQGYRLNHVKLPVIGDLAEQWAAR